MSVGAPQQILSGKYRLERELGRGGMGAVWLAEHMTLRSPVAIKLIDPSIAENPEALARFLREAQAAASLRSPHVVQILDHGVDAGVPFIVMELLEGESLAARIDRLGRLSPTETARVVTQVGRAVTRAHEAGIIHRDLKPDNIFLVRNDEEEVAKVLDFGVAKASSHGMGAVSGTTRTGSVLGTPYYMSPEQAEGAKSIDHRSDLWSLGVIAWECVLGTRPFEADTLGGLLLAICARDMPVPSSAGPVPPGFDAWFARACARSVELRFSSAKELTTELRQVCVGAGPESVGAYSAVPASREHGAAVPASSLPLASTMGHLSLSSSREPKKKTAASLLIGVGVGVGLAVAAGGAWVALRPATATVTAASVLASSPAAPPAQQPPEASAMMAPSAPVASASAVPAAAASSAPFGARPARPRVGVSKAKDKPAVNAPAPAAQPPPAPKQRVNLGI